MITKTEIIKNIQNNNANKITPTNIIYNHLEQDDYDDDDDEYVEYDDDSDYYTDYYSLNKNFTSLSTNSILETPAIRIIPETINSASTENLLGSNFYIKSKNNKKKIDLISISNNNYNSDIGDNKIKKFFFNNQNCNENTNSNNKNRQIKRSKRSSRNRPRIGTAATQQETAAAPNSTSSLSFTHSYDMFRYQTWIMPDVKVASLYLTKPNNVNNNIR